MSAPTDPEHSTAPPHKYAPPQEYEPATASPSDGANVARILTIVGFVLSGLALLFVPIVLGPVGAVLGGIGMRKGDPLGKWAIVAGVVCTIVGMVLGYVVFEAATS